MSDPPICRTITGEAVASPFRASLTTTIVTLPRPPKLLGLLANSSAPSRAYAEWTGKACRALGIDYELREIGRDGVAGEGEIEEAILEANREEGVNGIMVYVSARLILFLRGWN